MSKQDSSITKPTRRNIRIGGIAILLLTVVLLVAPVSSLAVQHPSSVDNSLDVFANKDESFAIDANGQVKDSGEANSTSGSNEELPNTLRIRSTGDERAYYEFSVSDSLEAKKNLDLTDSDAKIPDTITKDGSNGSVNKNGLDNFSFSGKITSFTLHGGNATVTVNGKQIDPSDYPDPEPDTAANEAASQSATDKSQSEDKDSNSNSPSITFDNQSTDGKTVTIDSVTVPDGGFVVLHGSLYQEGIGIHDTYAYSEYLTAGSHENVTIDISHNIPGDTMNVSRLNQSELLTATVHRDTNGNQEFNFYDLNADSDVPYSTANNKPIEDTAIAKVTGSENIAMPGGTGESTPRNLGSNGSKESDNATSSAGLDFEDQGTQGSTVTIDSVTIPDGGYVVVHNASYLPPLNNTLDSVIGVSEYLAPGNHTDVTIPLYNFSGYNGTQRRLQQSQQLVASVSYDSNNNKKYDFVTSGGADDVGYLYSNNTLVHKTGFVTVTGSSSQEQEQEQEDGFGNETVVPQSSTEQSNGTEGGNVPAINIEGQQVSTPTQTTETPDNQQSGGVVGFVFDVLTIIALVVLVAAIVIAVVAYRRS